MMFYGDEESVSIATGSSKPIHLAPSVTSVITADDIKKIGATHLDEVLETVPGLHVSLSSNRLNSIYSLRGIHTNENPQVLLLINGVPLTQLFSGGRPNSFRLPVANIKRVEIIRGPGSALYGADAFAGVINVITKSTDEFPGTHLGLRAGSFNSRDAWVQYGGNLGEWKSAFSFEYSKSDGDHDRIVNSDLQTTLDNTYGTDVSYAPGPLATRYEIYNTRLELTRNKWSTSLWNWVQNDAGIGAGGAQALDPAGKQDTNVTLFNIGYNDKTFAPNWEFIAKYDFLYVESQPTLVLFPPGSQVPIGSDGNVNFSNPAGVVTFTDGLIARPAVEDRHNAIEFKLSYTGSERHRTYFSAGYKKQELKASSTKNFGPGVIDGSVSPIDGTLTDVTGTSYIFIQDKDRIIRYLSAQDEWAFARDWELTAGVRYDDYSDFGDTVNPRFALVWATYHNLTSKLLYGRAFRAPSFGEQYSINNPVTLGNSNLDPETIEMLELVFDYIPKHKLRTQLGLFTYDIKDLIEFVSDPGGASNTAQNSKDQKGYGFEFETNWQASDPLTINAHYAWQHSEDKKTGDRIANAPRQKFHIAAHWNINRDWLLSTQANWIADRERSRTDTRNNIPDYTLVDVTLRYKKQRKPLELAASIRNLFDEDAREPSNGRIPDDYPLQGRSAYIEILYSFEE